MSLEKARMPSLNEKLLAQTSIPRSVEVNADATVNSPVDETVGGVEVTKGRKLNK